MSKPATLVRWNSHTVNTFTFDHPIHGRIRLVDYMDADGDGESEIIDANGYEIVDPDLMIELVDQLADHYTREASNPG